MAKLLIKQTFGVPSQSVSELKLARLSEAGYAFETKLRELEHQFDAAASSLREAYLPGERAPDQGLRLGNRRLRRCRGTTRRLPIIASGL